MSLSLLNQRTKGYVSRGQGQSGCICASASAPLPTQIKKNTRLLARSDGAKREEFPNPKVSSIPTFQTTRTCRRCRTHSISESMPWLPYWGKNNTRSDGQMYLLLQKFRGFDPTCVGGIPEHCSYRYRVTALLGRCGRSPQESVTPCMTASAPVN